MMKLLCILAFTAFVAGDVSHLFKGNNPYNPYNPYQKYNQFTGPVIPILRSESNVSPDGSYQYAYETGNGISAQEQGQQSLSEGGTVAQGAYQYTSPNGVPILVQYVADENGFQPSSNALPTPPPVPAAIIKSLQWNAAHPEEEN